MAEVTLLVFGCLERDFSVDVWLVSVMVFYWLSGLLKSLIIMQQDVL